MEVFLFVITLKRLPFLQSRESSWLFCDTFSPGLVQVWSSALEGVAGALVPAATLPWPGIVSGQVSS